MNDLARVWPGYNKVRPLFIESYSGSTLELIKAKLKSYGSFGIYFYCFYLLIVGLN